MARAASRFVCQECGAVHGKWAGRCGDCGAWNAIVEEAPREAVPRGLGGGKGKKLAFEDLTQRASDAGPARLASGIAEFDRVTGGGLVPGSAILVGGENYEYMIFTDELFWKSLWNTAFMLLGLPLSLGAGLGLAMLLHHELKGIAVYRTVYYLPAVMPVVASSVLWIWMFEPNRGLLNSALDLLADRVEGGGVAVVELEE